MKLYKLTLLVLLGLLAACTTQPTAPAPTDTPRVTAATETPVPLPSPTVELPTDGGTLEFAPSENVETTTLWTSAPKEQSDLNVILGNLSYSGIFEDHPIALTDGLAYYEDGGSQLPYVSLVDHRIPAGDLNGDGAEDAVVLLVDNTSGSGDFVYLAPVLNVLTKPTPLQAFLIGDRIPVKSLVIQGGQVIVELIAPGPGDPACCPSWNVRKIYSLENDRLVERSSQELGKVSLDDLNGTSWRLVDLDQGQEPLLPETEITLGFDDGQVSGSAGCNNYDGVVSGDANLPQTFVVGPITTTKKLCPHPISNQETTFLARLESVVAWRYDFGYLSLAYKIADNVFGELSFAPQAP